MGNLLKEKVSVGVIICRMQVPYLTESHKAVINTVLERHKKVIIFLGTSTEPISEKNPYPFIFRKKMIEQTFNTNKVTIIPLPDIENNNKLWVEILDKMIESFIDFDETAILYGGRDSFIPYYKKDKGKFQCTELAQTDYDSGTELRLLESLDLPDYTPEAAKSILWTIRQLTGKLK